MNPTCRVLVTLNRIVNVQATFRYSLAWQSVTSWNLYREITGGAVIILLRMRTMEQQRARTAPLNKGFGCTIIALPIIASRNHVSTWSYAFSP